MKVMNGKTEYSYMEGGCDVLSAELADGRLSVFQNFLPHFKGKYFLFND